MQKIVLTPKFKKIEHDLSSTYSQLPYKKIKVFDPQITQTLKTSYNFPRSRRERNFNISQILLKHQQTKCKRTGKSFDFNTLYGNDYKGIFKTHKNRMSRTSSNFFKNKYLEKRLNQIYKRGGTDKGEDIPKYTKKELLPMQTFYAQTFQDFKKTFRVPQNTDRMPVIKQTYLRSKAFSKVFIPYYQKVPQRELYDRDSFETDQYSKMLYVESKMDRLIKRHRQQKSNHCILQLNIERKNLNKKAKIAESKQGLILDEDIHQTSHARMTQHFQQRKQENKRRQRRLQYYHQKKFKDEWISCRNIDKISADTQSMTNKRQPKFKYRKEKYVKFRFHTPKKIKVI